MIVETDPAAPGGHAENRAARLTRSGRARQRSSDAALHGTPRGAPRRLTWKPDARPAPVLHSVGPGELDQEGAIACDPANGAASAGDIIRTFKPGSAAEPPA